MLSFFSAIGDVIAEAWRSLTRHPMRAILAALAVAIALGAVVAILAAEISWQETVRREYDKLGANAIEIGIVPLEAKVKRRWPNLDDVQAIRRGCPAIEAVDVMLGAHPVDVKAGRDHSRINGYFVGPKYLNIRGWATIKNPNLPRTSPAGCWISRFAARDLFGKVDAKTLPSEVRLNGRVTPLNGLVEVPEARDDAGEGYLFLPLGKTPPQVAPYEISLVAKARDLEQGAAQVDAVMAQRLGAKEPLQIATGPWRMAAEQIATRARFRLFTLVTLACILCVALLGVANTLLTSLEERTRDIALRRALGAQARRIMAEILTESALMCIIGGVAGCVLAFLGLQVLGPWLAKGMELPTTGTMGDAPNFSHVVMHMPWQALLIGWTACLLGALATAWVPAQMAARLQPSVALAAAPPRYHLLHRMLAAVQVLVGVCAAIVLMSLFSGMTKVGMESISHYSLLNQIAINGYIPLPDASGRVDMDLYRREEPRLRACRDSLWDPQQKLTELKQRMREFGEVRRTWFINDGFTSLQAKYGRIIAQPIIVGVDDGIGEWRGKDTMLVRGRPILSTDGSSGNRVCVITDSLGNKLFGHEDPLGQTIRLGGIPFTVVGIKHEKDYRRRVFFQTGQEANLMKPRNFEMVLPIGAAPKTWGGSRRLTVFLHEPRQARVAESKLSSVLQDISGLPPNYAPDIYNGAGHSLDWERHAWQLTLHATLTASAGLWIALVGLVNMLSASFYSRTREIGLLRALGATRGNIVWASIAEGGAIAGVGAVAGIGAAAALAFGVGHAVDLPVAIPATWAGIVVGSAVLASCLAALLPAAQAAYVNPSDALRNE